MTTTTGTHPAQAFLAAVAAHLADLPDADRGALLEDLGMHLSALEEEPDERPVEVRLGPPAAYAAELRAAAGLPPAPRHGRLWSGAVSRTWWRSGTVVVREVRALLPQLLPAWWVLRGYLVVLLPSLLGVSSERDFPVPAPLGSHFLGSLLVLAAVVGSVALGRRSIARPLMALVVLADVLLMGAAVTLVLDAPHRLTVRHAVATPPPNLFSDSPLVTQHGPVTDVFAYTTGGRPLSSVLLYDQDG
jgi:hypothetical protein